MGGSLDWINDRCPIRREAKIIERRDVIGNGHEDLLTPNDIEIALPVKKSCESFYKTIVPDLGRQIEKGGLIEGSVFKLEAVGAPRTLCDADPEFLQALEINIVTEGSYGEDCYVKLSDRGHRLISDLPRLRSGYDMSMLRSNGLPKWYSFSVGGTSIGLWTTAEFKLRSGKKMDGMIFNFGHVVWGQVKDGKYKLPRRNINVYIYTVEHKDTKRGYVIVNLPDITGAKLLSGDRKHKIEEAFLDPNESMSAMRKRLFSKRRRRIRWP